MSFLETRHVVCCLRACIYLRSTFCVQLRPEITRRRRAACVSAYMVAGFLLESEVSDLCIGKPAVRVLPPSTPIAAALATLRAGADPFVFVDAAPPDAKKTAALSVVKVSVAEILCYVCGNLGDPAAALGRPVYVFPYVSTRMNLQPPTSIHAGATTPPPSNF